MGGSLDDVRFGKRRQRACHLRKPLTRLGPAHCTDCILLWDPAKCDALLRTVRRKGILLPVDILLAGEGTGAAKARSSSYERGPYHGAMLDPSSDGATSVIRSMGPIAIDALNRAVHGSSEAVLSGMKTPAYYPGRAAMRAVRPAPPP